MSKLNTNTILKCEELSISFGGIKAVDNFSLEINEGEIVGLIGPNGAGKTTVFNMITQFYKPNEGNVYFRTNKNEEINLVDLKTHEVNTTGLTRTFQNIELVKELTVLENILVGAHIHFKSNLIQQIFRLPSARKEEKALREEGMKVLKELELDHIADQLVAGQAYGVLKKIELARALLSQPKLLILDEPAAGLNDNETIEFTQMVRNISKKYECSILLIEHDMRLVMDLCDKICAISFGKTLAIGTPSEIKANKEVQEAYLGEVENEN